MSLCNLPSLEIPIPNIDPMAALIAILQLLNISIPQMPTIALPAPFCPLD